MTFYKCPSVHGLVRQATVGASVLSDILGPETWGAYFMTFWCLFVYKKGPNNGVTSWDSSISLGSLDP